MGRRFIGVLPPVVLLGVHAGLLLGSLRHNFITVDELGHLSAGVSYWKSGTFQAYHVNPPLAKLIAAAPVLVAYPGADPSDPGLSTGGEVRAVASLQGGHPVRRSAFDLVCLGRLTGVMWSVLGGLLVYRWSAELFGRAGGNLSLALWCFEPNILGHAPLVTCDIPAVVTGLYATYAFSRYFKEPTWRRALLAGLALGLAALTKFTLLLFYAVWPALWVAARPWGAVAGRPTRHPASVAGQWLLAFVLSLYVINIGYGFEGSGRPLWRHHFSSRFLGGTGTTGEQPSLAARLIHAKWLADVPVPLPAELLLGIDDQRRDFEAHWPSYLAGEWRTPGWWYYYLYALAVKVPLGGIALVLWAAAAMAGSAVKRRCSSDEVVLMLTALAILAFVSSQTGFSHHMRYVLIIFPCLIINAGRLGPLLLRPLRPAGFAVWVLLLWMAASSLAAYPHTLSYFNEAAGGPRNGHAYLVDSNIDWGQDLLNLKRWIREHPEARPLRVAYFNTIDPRAVGIEPDLPPPGPHGRGRLESARPDELGPQPGYYAVSVNYLRGLTFQPPRIPDHCSAIRPNDYSYFLHFTPIARAGYSIYVYRITRGQANTVRRRLHLPPLPALEGLRSVKVSAFSSRAAVPISGPRFMDWRGRDRRRGASGRSTRSWRRRLSRSRIRETLTENRWAICSRFPSQAATTRCLRSIE